MSTATAPTTRTAEPDLRERQMHERQMHGMQPVIPQTADETKPSLKTTEFYVYLAAVAGVLLASLLVGEGNGDRDFFRADQAWWLISLMTIGYLVSRGLSKAGSHYRRSEERGRGRSR